MKNESRIWDNVVGTYAISCGWRTCPRVQVLHFGKSRNDDDIQPSLASVHSPWPPNNSSLGKKRAMVTEFISPHRARTLFTVSFHHHSFVRVVSGSLRVSVPWLIFSVFTFTSGVVYLLILQRYWSSTNCRPKSSPAAVSSSRRTSFEVHIRTLTAYRYSADWAACEVDSEEEVTSVRCLLS